jgi:hypothetical protein
VRRGCVLLSLWTLKCNLYHITRQEYSTWADELLGFLRQRKPIQM